MQFTMWFNERRSIQYECIMLITLKITCFACVYFVCGTNWKDLTQG